MGFKSKSFTKRRLKARPRILSTFHISLIAFLLVATIIGVILITLYLKQRTSKQTEQITTKNEIQETTTEEETKEWILTVNTEYDLKYLTEYSIFKNIDDICIWLINDNTAKKLNSTKIEQKIIGIIKETEDFIYPIHARVVAINNAISKTVKRIYYKYTLYNYVDLAKISNHMLQTIDSLITIKNEYNTQFKDSINANQILNFIVMKDISQKYYDIIRHINRQDRTIYTPIIRRLYNKYEPNIKWRNLGIIIQMIYRYTFYDITSETEMKMYGITEKMVNEDDGNYLGVWSIKDIKHYKEVVFIQCLYLALCLFEFEVNGKINTESNDKIFEIGANNLKPGVKEETFQELVMVIKKISLRIIELWFDNGGNFDLKGIRNNFTELLENILKMGDMLKEYE
eukprot:GAHX01002107.1.p1 GENE.GAHX01002107.1~~GAHX01002107.1.p1  ORF type:complete len:400 (+),score=60.50 GAHX01002107.1:165-1364(+)